MIHTPPSFLPGRTDNVYQNTDHLQLWERSPWKEEKVKLIICPSLKVMMGSFIKTPVVKDDQCHRMCGRIQWHRAICWLSKYIHNFFQLTIVKTLKFPKLYFCI